MESRNFPSQGPAVTTVDSTPINGNGVKTANIEDKEVNANGKIERNVETELFADLIEQPSVTEDAEPSDEATAPQKLSVNKNNFTKRVIGWVITLTVVLITAVFAYSFFGAKPNAEKDSANSQAQEATTIKLSPEQNEKIAVEVVQKRSVQGSVKSPGKVSFNSSQISPVLPQFSGRLIKLTAEIGQNVRAGQILGTIETPDIVQPQADYQQALANERTAQTTAEHTVRTRERDERLAKVEAIPLRELQDAQVDEKHAREDLERAEQAINAARSKLQSLHFGNAEIKTLETGSKVLSREVPLIAPISGTITERKAGLGQVVQPGGDPLFQIANLSNVWVNAEVYEDQLAKLRVGLPVSVETPAYPNEQFTARVGQIGSTVDPDKRTIAVRCVLPNTAGKLKPGMFVTVTLNGVSNEEVITVPATAIMTEADKQAVFVQDEARRFSKREVTTGGEQDGNVIIKSGLKNGEKVVTKGSLLVAAEAN